jgi:hypothetical protein
MAPAKTLQEQLIDRGHAIGEEIKVLTDQRAANRRSLRDLGVQGLLTEEELLLVDEMYPVREGKTDEERLAEAEQKAAELRERLEAAEAGEEAGDGEPVE